MSVEAMESSFWWQTTRCSLKTRILTGLALPGSKNLLFPPWIYLQIFVFLVKVHFSFLSVDEDCSSYSEGGGEDVSHMAMPGVGKWKWTAKTILCTVLGMISLLLEPQSALHLCSLHNFRCSASCLSAAHSSFPWDSGQRDGHCTWP